MAPSFSLCSKGETDAFQVGFLSGAKAAWTWCVPFDGDISLCRTMGSFDQIIRNGDEQSEEFSASRCTNPTCALTLLKLNVFVGLQCREGSASSAGGC